MKRADKRADADDLPESDAFPDAPHPRFAERLVGHAAAEAQLLAAHRQGRLPHAWLIGGMEGIGKATLAWRFARFVLANPDSDARAVQEAPDLSVDPNHPAARRLAALAHPDFALMRREWKMNPKRLGAEIAVDDVRAACQVFQMAPAFGGWRVAIVDSAEDLNRNSANALLKMIEEPPPRSLFLIVSHRPGQVLPTIRSRCRFLRLEPLSEGETVEIVRGLGPSWSGRDPEEIAAAAKRAGGSAREALARLGGSEETGALIDKIVARLPRPDPRAVLKLADALATRAADGAFQALHRELYDWLPRYALASPPERVEALGDLWDRLRDAARETETLNLDRRLHVIAVFAEIAAAAGGR